MSYSVKRGLKAPHVCLYPLQAGVRTYHQAKAPRGVNVGLPDKGLAAGITFSSDPRVGGLHEVMGDTWWTGGHAGSQFKPHFQILKMYEQVVEHQLVVGTNTTTQKNRMV